MIAENASLWLRYNRLPEKEYQCLNDYKALTKDCVISYTGEKRCSHSVVKIIYSQKKCVPYNEYTTVTECA